MRDQDRAAFAKLLQATADYYDRALTTDAIELYWRGLETVSIEQLRYAMSAHIRDSKAGQFMPKVADLLRQISDLAAAVDGHPGPEEAWGIAIQCRHEGATVVWTEQIADAYYAGAAALLDERDKVAARRAFIERYERVLDQARRAGVKARWFASLGSDPAQREQAIEQAVVAGRITREHAAGLLPGPAQIDAGAVALIENGVRSTATSPEQARERIDALRALLGFRRSRA